MAEAQLRQFLDKVRQLNAFVALSEADPRLRQELSACEHHDQVVSLARRCGFEIGRRWGEPLPGGASAQEHSGETGEPLAEAGERLLTPQGESLAVVSGLPLQGLAPQQQSLLAGPCPPSGAESTEVLLETTQWRLERIQSCDYRSPDGFWYEQQEDEWVLLLQGTARLRFADESSDRRLQPGDSLWIRAGRRHRVTATDPDPGTIWLALFWRTA